MMKDIPTTLPVRISPRAEHFSFTAQDWLCFFTVLPENFERGNLFFFNLILCIFILACDGSSLLLTLFSSCGE